MIVEKLQDIFREVFANDDLILSIDMGTDDIEEWDSFAHILLTETVESTFNIKIGMDEVFKIRTVADFVDVIEKNISE